MKKMNKTTIILLVVAIILTTLMLNGCIYERNLGYFQEQQIKKDYLEYFSIHDKKIKEVVLDYYGGSYNGYQIVMLDHESHDPEIRTVNISDSFIVYYDSNQLYAWKDGDFFTLEDAYLSGKFTNAEIAEIATQFNSRVTHFRDVGDVYDYNEKEKTSLFDCLSMDWRYYSKSSLVVTMDKKISVGNVTPGIDFFGSQYVKVVINNVGSSLYNNLNPDDENFEQSLTLDIHNTTSILKLLYIKKQIEKIPGVKKVDFVGVFVMTKNANDPYYVDSSDDNYQWGLDAINVKQVWDFTTATVLEKYNADCLPENIKKYRSLQ